MIRGLQIGLLSCFACFGLLGQVDSLKQVYPKLKGKERIQVLLDITYYQSLGNTAESKHYGRMAEKEARQLGDSALLANVWNDWSLAYFYAGELDSSLLLNQQALRYRTKLKDTLGMAKSLNKIASTYYEMGLHDACLKANLTSLRYFERAGADQFLGQVYTNIGNVYDRVQQYELAAKYHQRSIDAAKEIGNLEAEVVARLNIANSFLRMGKVAQSRESYLLSITQIRELGNDEYLAGAYQGLGVLERESGNLDAAIAYYKQSIDKYREVGAMGGVSLVAVNLGNAYLDKQQYDRAEDYLREGLEIALKMHSHYNVRHAYKGLTRLENLKGNYEAADRYFDLYVSHMDSMYNEESTKSISEMQVRYETEQKDKRLAEAEVREKNTTILLLAAGGSLLLLLIITGWVVQRRRLERKNAELENLRNLERERTRIARDLHDNLGAELTMITSKLDMKTFRTTSAADKDELEEIGKISRNANHVLRETIWSIHKEDITVEELMSKSREYVDRIFGSSGTLCRITSGDPDAVLSPSVALHLFRIIQEAVNNARKYASCTELTIEIMPDYLLIRDNGSGFDEATVAKGYGLQNMRQRADELNAHLTVQSTPGAGTGIRLDFQN